MSTTLTRNNKSSFFLTSPSLITVIFLIFGTLAAFVGGGNALRLAFPAGAFLLSCYFIYLNRKDCLIELVIALFLITPFVRRVVDNTSGFQAANVLMLSPYMASLITVPIAINKLIKASNFRYQTQFYLIYIAIIYGLVIALFEDRFFAGGFEAVTWITPLSIGLIIALEPENRISYETVFVRTLLIGVPLISFYGVYQFIYPPAWDTYWMINVKMTTIGLPEPFAVRVFGTMNSPASYAQDLVFAILIIMSRHSSLLRLPALTSAAIAVLLSMVRTSWIGFIGGLICLLILGNSVKVKASVLGAVLFLTLSIPIMIQIPQVDQMLSDRFESFSSGSSDASAEDRWESYVYFFTDTIADSPLGEGFGNIGVRSAALDNGKTNSVDGAPIQIGTVLGLGFGLVYIISVGVLILAAIKIARENNADQFINACASVLVCAGLMFASGNITIGECGIFFWIVTGFCLALSSSKSKIL